MWCVGVRRYTVARCHLTHLDCVQLILLGIAAAVLLCIGVPRTCTHNNAAAHGYSCSRPNHHRSCDRHRCGHCHRHRANRCVLSSRQEFVRVATGRRRGNTREPARSCRSIDGPAQGWARVVHCCGSSAGWEITGAGSRPQQIETRVPSLVVAPVVVYIDAPVEHAASTSAVCTPWLASCQPLRTQWPRAPATNTAEQVSSFACEQPTTRLSLPRCDGAGRD